MQVDELGREQRAAIIAEAMRDDKVRVKVRVRVRVWLTAIAEGMRDDEVTRRVDGGDAAVERGGERDGPGAHLGQARAWGWGEGRGLR